MRCRVVPPCLLAAFAVVPLLAQEEDFSCGISIHLGTLLEGNGSRTGSSAANRFGSGIEGYAHLPWNDLTGTRAVIGFTGIRTGSWQDELGDSGGEYWRSLRFGLEQTLTFKTRTIGRPYIFMGGGVQETWVVRTTGNLFGATFAALVNLFSDAYVDYRYAQHQTALDSWGGYGTMGVGWRFRESGFVELRAVRSDHQEYTQAGLTTQVDEPKTYHRGTQCFLSAGMRF